MTIPKPSEMRVEIYSDGSSIDPNDISLFGVKGMKYGAKPPVPMPKGEEIPKEPGISKEDALRILEAHLQSYRSKKCKCGWKPTYLPGSSELVAWPQHREHVAEMLATRRLSEDGAYL